MEAKEKAEILISHFMGLKEFNLKFEKTGWASMNLLMSKECALIAVDEIIWALKYECPPAASNVYQTPSYWSKVKQEIEKL